METKFDKPSVVRQPNAQRILKPSVLGKPAPFSDSLKRRYFSKTKSVPKTNVSEGLSKTVTAQTLPHTAWKAVSNTNVLKPGMYRIDNRTTQTRAPQSPQTFRNTNPRVSNSTRVNQKTNVSRPQHRSNQIKDKVVPNNTQVKLKKTQVEDHPRIPNTSNKIKSVTACNDSLNSRTSNANVVYATCGKCLVDFDHFACVTKMLNDVNARTKKPNVVPISTRKPKGNANKSVATPYKQKVASKSITQKPKSYYRMLYEKSNKAWKWWIEQQCPSGYKWIVQLILFLVDSGCTKHMTGNLKLLYNFVEKFLGFITSKASITISSQLVNFVMRIWRLLSENLHVLLEIFRTFSSQLRLHQPVVIGLPKLKYVNDQLCSSCEVSKAKRSSFKSKVVPSSKGRLNMLHMDLCGPMRVASINGKKYILMKEKGDPYILVGYSTQSKEYCVYNQRTRLIVESIHIRFDEIKEMSETVNKSSSPTNNSNQQDTQPTTSIQPTSEPSTPTYVHAEENNVNQAEEEHLLEDEFTNPFCTPVQEVDESLMRLDFDQIKISSK
nr:Gag-Pol polyprotein [Tanacetum cinerariifolium]